MRGEPSMSTPETTDATRDTHASCTTDATRTTDAIPTARTARDADVTPAVRSGRDTTGRPGRWRRLLPVPVEPARLPEIWRLVHQPETDDYAVLGCRGDDPPTVVIRIAYAAGDDGSDLRLPLASLVTVGIAKVVRQRIHQI